MHISKLTHRTQILLDDERYERLQRQAERSNSSLGSLVREAIDLAYPEPPKDPARAIEELLAMDPIPVDDWDVMKREITSMREKHLPDVELEDSA